MEKKTPGRELDQISDIFLSTSKKKESRPGSGFSAFTIRDQTCESCTNLIQGAFREPKCRIFTFENEKYGVPHLDSITLNFAKYCEHYEGESGNFSHQSGEDATDPPDHLPESCEIEETVITRKKIVFPDTETARSDMKRALLLYLEGGYTLKMSELEKSKKSSSSQGHKIEKQEIILAVKPD